MGITQSEEKGNTPLLSSRHISLHLASLVLFSWDIPWTLLLSTGPSGCLLPPHLIFVLGDGPTLCVYG